MQHRRSAARFVPCARPATKHSGSLLELIPTKKTSRGSLSPQRSQENFGTNRFAESLKFFGLLSRVRKLCSASHCTCNRKAKTPSQELKRDAATCCRAPLSVKGSAFTQLARLVNYFIESTKNNHNQQ